MKNINNLYKALLDNNLLTISFDEFLEKYKNEEYKQQVFKAVTQEKLFTKDYETFNSAYSLPQTQEDESSGGVINFLGDLFSAFKGGYDAAASTGEANVLQMQGSDITPEAVSDFVKSRQQEAKEYKPSARMLKFQKQYEKEGKTWTAFFRGIKEQPGLMAEMYIQSLGTQIGTVVDSPTARAATAAGIGAGAAAGSALPGYGTVAGGLAGGFGATATAMESALTFSELIDKELQAQGKKFTDENVMALLKSEKGNDIRNKSLARGLTIGAIETLTGGLAGKATQSVMKTTRLAGKTKLATAAITGTAIEGVGGGLGEVAGRIAADQEMDPAEIGFEAITGTTTAPATVGYQLLTFKDPIYELNGEKVSYGDMKKFVDTASDDQIARANIKIENDRTGLQSKAAKKQTASVLDSQIDDAVTDKKDRQELIRLQEEKTKLERKAEKKGIEKVPNAAEDLAVIDAEIEAIIGKYEGAVEIGKSERAKSVKRARLDILKDEITGKVKKMKAYKDMDIDTFEGSIDEVVEQYTNNLIENANYDLQVLEAELKGYQEKGDTKAVKRVQEMIADRQSILEDAAKGLTQDEKGKKIKISEAINAGTYGMLIEDNATGKLKMVLNKEADITDEKGYINVAAHEFLHAALRKTFFKKSDVVTGMTEAKGAGIQTGQKLINHLLESNEVQFVNEIKSRLEAYGAVDKDGKINLTEDLQAQEVLNLLSDATKLKMKVSLLSLVTLYQNNYKACCLLATLKNYSLKMVSKCLTLSKLLVKL